MHLRNRQLESPFFPHTLVSSASTIASSMNFVPSTVAKTVTAVSERAGVSSNSTNVNWSTCISSANLHMSRENERMDDRNGNLISSPISNSENHREYDNPRASPMIFTRNLSADRGNSNDTQSLHAYERGFDGQNGPNHTVFQRQSNFDDRNGPSYDFTNQVPSSDGIKYPSYTNSSQNICFDGQNGPSTSYANVRYGYDGHYDPSRDNRRFTYGYENRDQQIPANIHFGYDGYDNPNQTFRGRMSNISAMNFNDSCPTQDRNTRQMALSTLPSSNMHRQRVQYGEMHRNEPRVNLPSYSGNTSWKSFIMQFQLLADRFDWGRRRQAEEIILCLRDEAQSFVAQLPVHIRQDIDALNREMDKRFGDHTLPETYRRNLQNVQKSYSETYQKYAARVEQTVRKAYPGINESLFNELCVEYMLNGIPDRNIAYDVLTKRPKSLDEAINLLTWHNSCKNGLKVQDQDCDDDTSQFRENHTNDVRRINHKRFVTEERLQQFGRELKDSITENVTKAVSENLKDTFSKECRQIIKEEIKGLNRNPYFQSQGKHPRDRQKNGDIICYSCKEPGHISRDCPLNKEQKNKPKPEKRETRNEENSSQKSEKKLN